MEYPPNDRLARNAVPPTAAGTTDVNGTANDHKGFGGGIDYYVNFGALTATHVTKLVAQECDTSGGTYVAFSPAIEQEVVDADANGCVTLHVPQHRIGKRYQRVVVDRGTANAVVEGGVAVHRRMTE